MIFAEYQIIGHQRQSYFQYLKQRSASDLDVEIYEGKQQPNLFVEVWKSASLDEVRALLMDGRLEAYVSGGAAKIHIWEFIRCPL